MATARRALILFTILASLGSSTVLAQRGRGQNPGLSEQQRKNIEAIIALADTAAKGSPVPNDLGLTWIHDDFLRTAQTGSVLVPFIFTIDEAKVKPGVISLYWRVVDKNAPPPPAPDPKAKKPVLPTYAYEALTPTNIAAGQSLKMSRSFAVPAGSYDVYIVAKEGSPTDDPKKAPKNAPPAKVSVIKQSVVVPDLWNGELSTSSLLIIDKINTISAPLSGQEMVSRPYALGGAELVPFTTTKFTKRDQMAAFLLIYNAKGDTANHPDVKAEFNFYTVKGGAPEVFFNAAPPNNLNAQTMPGILASSQLQASAQVPLEAFPEGTYRLEVKVTDNLSKKEVKREFTFSVSGS